MPEKTYKVVQAFRDQSGKDRKPGEAFKGTAQEIQAALAAGQVQETPPEE